MKKTPTATLIAALAVPVMAGGAVLLEDTEVVAQRPTPNFIVPLLAVVAIGLLFRPAMINPRRRPASAVLCSER